MTKLLQLTQPATNGLSLDRGKFLVAGRMGLGCNLRLNDHLSINIEGNANVLSGQIQLQRKRAMPTGSSMLSLV